MVNATLSISSNGKRKCTGLVIGSQRDMEVYQQAMTAAMDIFALTREFPKEEMYSLSSQVRRSSRSAVINFIQAWRKRRYEGAFISKLSDAETEAAETQGHIEFAVRCGYLVEGSGRNLFRTYEGIMNTLVGMIHHADRWLNRKKSEKNQKK